MVPADVKPWRKRLSLTQQRAADALGIAKSTLRLYEAGKRSDNGRPVVIPKAIALACAAIEKGIDPL